MKTIFGIILVFFSLKINAQEKILSGFGIEDTVYNLTGVIQLSGDTYLLNANDPARSFYATYLPFNLKDEFKRDSLKVVFSGITGKIPANIRMMGTPLHVTAMRKWAVSKPVVKKKKSKSKPKPKANAVKK